MDAHPLRSLGAMTDAVPLVRGLEHGQRHLGCDRFHQEPGNKRVLLPATFAVRAECGFDHRKVRLVAVSVIPRLWGYRVRAEFGIVNGTKVRW